MPKRVPVSELEFSKIAVIRFGDADEIMQTLPAIRVLKQQYKDAQIHFVVREEFADVLRDVEEITKIHTIKKEPFALTKTHDKLANEFMDLVIDLQNDFQSSFLYSAFPGVPKRMYKKYKLARLLKKPIPPLWKRFLNTLPRPVIKNDSIIK